MRRLRLHIIRLAAALCLLPGLAHAQSTNRVLSEATIQESDRCSVVGVSLNIPVRLVSVFPTGVGDEVRIRVAPIEGGAAVGQRESLTPPASDQASISRIEFEGDRPEGPTLVITFTRPVHFQFAQGADFRSFILAVSGDQANPDCVPTTQRPLNVASGPVDPALPPSTVATDAAVSPEDKALVAEARAAITGGDYPRAIQLLTKLLQKPDSPANREARELLGIARERNGQAAHAKAEYEEYLRLYGDGPGADRVRQRLASLLVTARRPRVQPGATETARGGGEWRSGGSLAVYYMRDNSYQQIDDTATNTTTTEADTNLNQILTTFDAFTAYSGGDLRVKLRATGAYTSDFRVDGADEAALSALFIEVFDAPQRYYLRVGRQTRSTGGVLGRFDGGLAWYRFSPVFKLEAVAGAPVESTRDINIDSSRVFYGVSLVFGRFAGAWDGDIYVIEQRASGVVDRRAVGLELRYVSTSRAIFGAIDYDTHFGRLNYALINSSWNFGEGGTFTLAYDYRRSPLLFTSDAVLGQTVFTLDALRGLYSDAEIHQLALDRTAQARSAAVGVSYPINAKLTFNADITAASLSATPDSGGVPATPASGTEYYYSAQLIGSSLFREGDIGIIGLRYADTAAAARWVIDLNARYPVTREFRVNPRLRLGYRTSRIDTSVEYSVRPSMRFNYSYHRRYQFELDAGGEWLTVDTPLSKESTTGYYVNFGVRRDF